MAAFAYLYGLANHNILRRIERPELPLDALDALGDALLHRPSSRTSSSPISAA